MNNKFQQEVLRDHDDHKGANITLNIKGEDYHFNVEVNRLPATEDNRLLRINHNLDSEVLVHIVKSGDFKIPTVTYSDDKTHCYVTFYNYSVHIKLDDTSCIIFEVINPSHDENPISSRTMRM